MAGQGTPDITDDPDLVSWGAHANLTFEEMLEKLYDTSFFEKVYIFMLQLSVSTSLTLFDISTVAYLVKIGGRG